MDDGKIYDITYLFEAPMSGENKHIDNVIKVVSSKGRGKSEQTIAIDIQNEKIYLDPRISTTGIEAKTGSVPVSDVDEVLSILKNHRVQDWNKDETITYEDEDEQSLWLQFEDGTVERYSETSIAGKTNPLVTLVQEIEDFVDARVIKIDPKLK